MKNVTVLAATALAFAFVSTAPARSPQATPSGEVRAAFAKLMTDTKAALADSAVTPEQWQALKSSVGTAIEGANKPAPATTKKLAATIQLARQDDAISDAERTAIYRAFVAVLNSANVPLEEAAAVRNAVVSLAMSANVTPDEIMVILADLRALFETLPTKP